MLGGVHRNAHSPGRWESRIVIAGEVAMVGQRRTVRFRTHAGKRLMNVPVYFELVITRYSATAANYLCR